MKILAVGDIVGARSHESADQFHLCNYEHRPNIKKGLSILHVDDVEWCPVAPTGLIMINA
jgi:hypothetical protein